MDENEVQRSQEIDQLSTELVEAWVHGRFTFEAFSMLLTSARTAAETPYDGSNRVAAANRALFRLRQAVARTEVNGRDQVPAADRYYEVVYGDD